MKIVQIRLFLVVILGALSAGLYGNQSFTFATQTLAASGASSSAVVIAKNAKFGQILVNARGFALYYFTPDRGRAATCAGSCAKFWPPLIARRGAVSRSSHLPGKIGVVMRSDGAYQVTYNGWPLYTYIGDKHAGAVTGQGVGGFFVATPKLGASHHSRSPAPHATPLPAPAPQPTSCIPGNNGGDGDSDNNGNPTDGDGCF
jgi:predicted lipoprotein with Yx(FWY)xxD motif